MALFAELAFRYPFRKYQRMILAQVESGQGDRKYHIVAPPGSGKTIIGLELIRRFGAPAVIFAPTTTIQQQWQEKLGLFVTEPAQVRAMTSLDPASLAPINIFTYQVISTPGAARSHVRDLALQRWINELLIEGRSADEEAARARLDTLQHNNPRGYDRELARRYLAIKRDLLRGSDVDVAQFLHPNACRLIEDLVRYGVRTVVLDECHHLLDYWAIVLRYLIRQIEDPRAVGLTATLPSPEDDEEYENYTSLVGEVDFEVPTPAVVKEGDLAPYRDLVYFVPPSPRERAYLQGIQQAFEAAIAELTQSSAFQSWVVRLIVERPGPDGAPVPWQDWLNANPMLALAGLRFLRHTGHPLPSDLLIPLEAAQDPVLEDWLALLEHYALDELKVSPDPAAHQQLAALQAVLQPFGLSITERGLRQGRSAGDLVLALSESKDAAVAHILSLESQAMGERLRSVVVTDFERMSSGVGRRLQGVLARDAGSALRVFRQLLAVPECAALNPLLVTGSTLMIGAAQKETLLAHLDAHLQALGLQATCACRETSFPGVLEVVATGCEWRPRLYVPAVTAAFEQGLSRCLVGTRGIFGEGWDSLHLNTLIDLTSVTTSTSVQQLRGRSIRKDPDWPHKVAHNWDVVCVARKFQRGDTDLLRFERRHARYWGVAPLSAWRDAEADAAWMLMGGKIGPQWSGGIVKGVCHVDPNLAYELATVRFDWIRFGRYNRHMLRQIRKRERTYNLWGVGQEYSNFAYSATRLETRDLKIRTVYTVEQTLKRMLREFLGTMLFGATLGINMGIRSALDMLAQSGSGNIGALELLGFVLLLLGLGLIVGLGTTFALNLRSAYRLGKALLVEQPADAILLDAGRALLAALREAGLVSNNLQPEYIRVLERPDSSYQVFLDYASPQDAATFIQAYRQILAPVRDQRYLILRDDGRLPHLALIPLWAILRLWLHRSSAYAPAYHPVPDVLATRRERADALARYWRKYVGGGRLVFTRSEKGRQLLLRARAQRRPRVRSLAFEIWR